MTSLVTRFSTLLALALPLAAQSGPACAGQPACAEVSSFVANITDFRTSAAGRFKVATATIRFQNKGNRPLALGYVNGSGVVVDDQGNRYGIGGANGVRGIGIIASQVDPKFVIAPGAASDARFEFLWAVDSRKVFGLNFEMELAVREIVPLPTGQVRLGAEHALHFEALTNRMQTGTVLSGAPAAVAPGAAVASAPAPAAAPAGPVADPCQGVDRCYSAGAFTAQVMSINSARVGTYQDHVLRFQIRFRNLTDRPIVLGYKSGTSLATDEGGNRYYWGTAGTHDTSVQGIGVITGSKADPQFVLQPGEARPAVFQVRRRIPRNGGVGSSFTYEATIEQLEILPSQQIRTVREYPLNFSDLRASGGVGASAESFSDAARKLQGIFKKK